MDSGVILNYAEKVYGYAVNHTYSHEEADDLSQEILFTLVRELPKLKDESKFEPWLWGVANNVTKSFRRHMGKQRAMFTYDVPEDMVYNAETYNDQEEVYDFLRSKIAMLSAIYRDIIVLYYYDGLSTKQISEKLDIPEGTVTWRLSEARKKIKKECTEMKETALRPKKIHLDIYGSGDYNNKDKPFPNVYIEDALSQNILYHSYESPSTVEELAKICGVPAYFVEDRIDNLLKREAIIEIAKGKYQANFVIWTDKHGEYCEENAEKVLLPIMDKLVSAIRSVAIEAEKIDFYKADKSGTDLFYLYGILAFDYLSCRYCRLPYPDFEVKFDGLKWNYIGSIETGKYRRTKIGVNGSLNLGSRGSCNHTVYFGMNGIAFRKMMFDHCINACEDIIFRGYSEDASSVAEAVKAGYIIKKDDGSFFVTVPCFTAEQKRTFDGIVEKYFAKIMPEYSQAVEKFIEDYKKIFPKHLGDDIDRLCQNMFMGLYSAVVSYAQRTGAFEMPSKNCYCDVMIQR
ncbi:MAG: sigma-70 family RNA polymerase sigma factor [Ruminococcaceae bacterium]|nr:sigma-70 family RNA polymerase sigma factor [Oscillospiraceae bacterium]